MAYTEKEKALAASIGYVLPATPAASAPSAPKATAAQRQQASRDNSLAAQMQKDRQEAARRQAQRLYEEAAKRDNAAWFQKARDDAVMAAKEQWRVDASRDNSAGWQKVRDDPEQYQKDALDYSYDFVQELISRYDEAVEAENKASQYVGTLYSSEGAEENLAAAQDHRKAIADELAIYGVSTNGSQVDASNFYDKFFALQTEKAKEAARGKPVDTVALLLGDEGAYAPSRTELLTDFSNDQKTTLAYLREQDEKNGTNLAEIYRQYIESAVIEGRALEKATNLSEMDYGLGRTLAYGGAAAQSGFDAAINELAKTLGINTFDQTQSQQTAGLLRAGLEENGTALGQFGFDALQSVGAMVPGIVAGGINPVVGAAVFATTTGSSGYQQKLAEGWLPNDAAAYGILVGIAEAGLQYATGGIDKLGGKFSVANLAKNIINKIDPPVIKAVANALVRSGAEFTDEFLQTYIEPAIVSAVQGTEYDTPEFREAIRNGMLGAVTSLGLGAGEFVGDIRGTSPTTTTDNAQAPQTTQSAFPDASGEITPTAPQNAEIAPLNELNTQATQNEAANIIGQLTSGGRINNTTADLIAKTPALSEAFARLYSRELGGAPIAGTSHEQRTMIQNAVRQRAATQGASRAAVESSERALTEYSADEISREAAWNVPTPQPEPAPIPYENVQNVLENGATPREAKAILDSPELRAAWEALTGQTLPESRNRATRLIMGTRQSVGQDALLEVAGLTPSQTAAETDAPVQQATQTGTPTRVKVTPRPAPATQPTGQDVLLEAAGLSPATSATAPARPTVTTNVQPPTVTATTAETTQGQGPVRERAMSEGVRTNEANEAELRQSFEDSPETYTQLTNAEVQARSDAIMAKGFDSARTEVTEAVGRAKEGMKLAPEYALAAQEVANEMTRRGEVDAARNLMADVIAEFTAAGQFAQIGRLVRQADPATKTLTIQKLVDKLNKKLSSRQAKKNVKRGKGDTEGKIVISEELLNSFATAPDDATRNSVMTEIEKSIADQIPATFRDKFTALRYLNMLGNFKTQGRNITGNALAAVATSVKRRVQAVTELGAALATGGKYERTTSLFVSPELRKAAAADFANVESVAMGEAKYSDVGRQANKNIRDKQRIFDNPLLEGYRKATNWAMEVGDRIFLKFHYADALAGYLQAHGVASIDQASPEMLNRARDFAIKEAQEATFRDDNAVSNFVTKVGRGKDTPKLVKAISEGIMPFRKTPANVAVRAVEYSPLGFVKAGVDAYRVSQDTASSADVINDVAKSATGSALAVAGYLLAEAGLAKGTEEDDELAAFQKTQGEMDYSIKIGDSYVSLSQFAPMAVPFFMGVKLQEILEAQEGAMSLDSITELLGAITDPMLEMSMLSGVNDAFSNLSNVSGDSDALPQLVINSMMSYLSQGLTNSLLRQAEQASEETWQTNYTANETPIDEFLGQSQDKVGQISAGIPIWDYHQQDYVDAWGRTQSNGSELERFFNAFLNPTYSSEDRSTVVDAELERLYRDNKNVEDFPDVFPQNRSRSDVYGDGKVMTPDEYLQFSKDSGQMKLELVSDFMDSEQYSQLNDEQRAEVISDLYSFAEDRALKKVKEANDVNSASDWDDEAELENLPFFLGAKTAFADATDPNNEAPNYDAVDALLAGLPEMDKATRDALDEQSGFKNVRFASEVYGMDAETAIGLDKLLDSEQKANLMGGNSGTADIVVISKSFKGSDEEKLAALEVANIPYANTGTRRSIVRRTEAAMGAGIKFDDWAVIEAYVDKTKTSDNPGKSTIVAAGNALGYDGEFIYEIYKNYPNDEEKVEKTNDYFHKDYVAPEDIDYFEYLTGTKLS